MSAYDSSNVFAKILRGELPATKVYEDDYVLAFMDIMPRGPGHTLVIPKTPARGLLDYFWNTAKRIAETETQAGDVLEAAAPEAAIQQSLVA